jgi:ascorbate-specific PTS system EIIC-type component UlaA
MNKEEFDINQELEQMRQDYADLKERFDKQQIINEQLMQNAMKKDVRRMFLSKKTVPIGIALTLLAVILCYVQGMAWWLTLSIIIYGIIFIPGVYWAYNGVREEEIYNGDILSTTETLRRFKKRYIIWVTGMCLYFFAFVVAGTIYMTSMNISAELMWRRGILVALLCVGTLALEYYSAKRLLNTCDAIIERLKMKDE